MNHRPILIGAAIMAVIWCVVICTCLSRAELPAGMHRANVVQVDTAWRPHVTPVTLALDSLDSLWRIKCLK